MKKKITGIVLTSLLIASQFTFISVSQARNTPIAPLKSTNSSIDFDQPDDLFVDDNIFDLIYPQFDFEEGDIEVTVDQASAPITMINIKLPNGFVATGFDSDDTYIEELDDSTICDVDNWSLSLSSDGVTAKGFSCSDSDGTVNFRFDVDDLNGYITSTTPGSYSIESQFRTTANRSNKLYAYVVEEADALVLIAPLP